MIDKNLNYVIIGATNNQEKYGYKVLMDLLQAGYKVIPVNPKGGEIGGLKVFPNLASISEKVDVVIFVVPPAVTVEVLPQVKAKGISRVWLQPGSESEQAIKYCQENDLDCIHNACIMIEKNK